MKFTKKLMSVFLVLAILGTTLIGSFSLPVSAKETQADDGYIYYSDLFYAYPHLLNSSSYFDSYVSTANNVYSTVYQGYEKSPLLFGTGLDKAFDMVLTPTELASFISDKMGITNFSLNNAMDAANEMFIRELLKDSPVYEAEKNLGQLSSLNKKIGSVLTYIKKAQTTLEDKTVKGYMDTALQYLTDNGYLKNFNRGYFNLIWNDVKESRELMQQVLDISNTEIGIANALVTAYIVEDSRLSIVNDILATQTEDTLLKRGMQRLQSQLQGGFVARFIDDYIVDGLGKKIASTVNSWGIIAGKIIPIVGEIRQIVEIANKVFDAIVDVPSYAEVIKYQVLIAYATDLAAAKPDFVSIFTDGPISYREIQKYENYFLAFETITKSAIKTSEDFADMLDPYADAYAVLKEAAENGKENVTVTTSNLTVEIPSSLTDEEFYLYMTLQLDASATISALTKLPLVNNVQVTNGTTTVKLDLKANLLLSAFRDGLSEEQKALETFNTIIKGTSLYEGHVNSLKASASSASKISKEVYSTWYYETTPDCEIKQASDTIQDGCIYTVNSVLLGNLKITKGTSYIEDTITVDGDVKISNNAITYGDLIVLNNFLIGYCNYITEDHWNNNGNLIIYGNLLMKGSGSLINNGEITVIGSTVSNESGGRTGTVTNNGIFNAIGDFSPFAFNMTKSDTKLIIGSNCTLQRNLSYNWGSGNSIIQITDGFVIFNGNKQQEVKGLTAPKIFIDNNSEGGVVFLDKVVSTVLFQHNGNNFTLNKSGTFVDYDGDGLLDNVDPQPTVGNPCTINFVSNKEHGSVSIDKTDTIGGTEIAISAAPTEKYEFSKWVNSSGSTVSTSADAVIVAKGDDTITAVFVKRSHPITTNCENGVINVVSSAEIESEVTVSVTPNDGYLYKEGTLSYNGIAIEDGSFIMPDEEVILTAEFTRNDNYFLLKDKIDEAKSYSQDDYTIDSFASLSSTITSAEAVLVNEISEEESQTHIENLQKAIDSLATKQVISIEALDYTIYYSDEDAINSVQFRVAYDNQTEVTVTNAECVISNYSCYTLGTQNVSVAYDGFTQNIDITVLPLSITECEISNIPNQLYNKNILEYEPTLSITNNEITLTSDNYTVEYFNNTAIGTATAIITGIGNYIGIVEVSFDIYCEHSYEELETDNSTYLIRVCQICDEISETDSVAICDYFNSVMTSAKEIKEYQCENEIWQPLQHYINEGEVYTNITNCGVVDLKNMVACANNIEVLLSEYSKQNLALGKEIIVDSVSTETAYMAENLNDGDLTTRWQSAEICSEDKPSYAGIKFDQPTTIDVIDVYWELGYPEFEYEKVQYSSDGIYWKDVENVCLSDITYMNDIVNTNYQHITFKPIKTKFIRVLTTSTINNGKYALSIWELEAYNSAKIELETEDKAWGINTLGAQIRDNKDIKNAHDLRFVTAVSSEFLTDSISNITALGVILARADQLEAAGLDGTALTLDFENSEVITRKLSAVYLNNSTVNTDNYYMYYSTITGITSDAFDREYVAVAYCTVGGKTYYSNPVTRCVNNKIA